jgi:hypothetical protein
MEDQALHTSVHIASRVLTVVNLLTLKSEFSSLLRWQALPCCHVIKSFSVSNHVIVHHRLKTANIRVVAARKTLA